MKTPLEAPTNIIETEAEDHAEETRYAVSHHGQELHREKPDRKKSGKTQNRPDEPWQMD
jgi:hypothetical protein